MLRCGPARSGCEEVIAVRQIAALPYRLDQHGAVLVLLITSRDTKRWVIPKGNPIAGLPPHLAAAREAFEEAGVIGTPQPAKIGSFRYEKRRKSGATRTATVDVYALPVATQLETWPEHHQRDTTWFSREEAAQLVDEPELREIIRTLCPRTDDGRASTHYSGTGQ